MGGDPRALQRGAARRGGARDRNGDGLRERLGEQIDVEHGLCIGFECSRDSTRELSTDDANRLRSLFGLAPVTQFADDRNIST